MRAVARPSASGRRRSRTRPRSRPRSTSPLATGQPTTARGASRHSGSSSVGPPAIARARATQRSLVREQPLERAAGLGQHGARAFARGAERERARVGLDGEEAPLAAADRVAAGRADESISAGRSFVRAHAHATSARRASVAGRGGGGAGARHQALFLSFAGSRARPGRRPRRAATLGHDDRAGLALAVLLELGEDVVELGQVHAGRRVAVRAAPWSRS